MPATIVIVSAGDFDVARLAEHLAQTSRGGACVARVSICGTSNGALIDYASICARIWEHLERRNRPHDVGLACPDGEGCTNSAPDCAEVWNLPAVPTEPITGIGRQVAKSPSVSGTNGAAYFGPDDQSSARSISNPITVMVASDRVALLKALLPRLAAERDIDVLGDPVVDAELLPLRLEERQPGLLLLDKGLLNRLGPQDLQLLHKRFPEVRVLLLCDEFSFGLVKEVLRNHFEGLLLTSSAPDAYVRAIRAISQGELWLPRASLAKAIFDLMHAPQYRDSKAKDDRSRAHANDSLTDRERQIVELLRQGFTNKEIARRLGIKEDTVKKHLQSVFGKLGVHRRTLVLLRQVSGQFNGSHDVRDLPL